VSATALAVLLAPSGTAAVTSQSLTSPRVAGALEEGLSTLRATVRAPPRVEYDPQSLGAAGQFVTIDLENAGNRAVPVSSLHASFTATRDGVAFQCNTHVGAPLGTEEPSHLDPGQSHSFERLIDCTFPLTGRYEVSVWLHGAEDGGEAAGGFFAGSFPVEVTANDGNAPRPIPGRPGLYGFMTGAPTTAPSNDDAEGSGKYRLVVALINGAAHDAAPGPARLSLTMSRHGGPTLCSTNDAPLDEPAVIAPAGVHVERVALPCPPVREGAYEILGRATFGGGADVELGRVDLVVTSALPYPYPTPPPVHWP
jgi:hypothetical protein